MNHYQQRRPSKKRSKWTVTSSNTSASKIRSMQKHSDVDEKEPDFSAGMQQEADRKS
jgi:hypothetical protein